MARIPIYDSNTSVTDGSGTFRLQGNAAAESISGGLRALGRGLDDLASASARMQDRSEKLAIQDEVLQIKDWAQQKYLDGSANMPRGGGQFAQDFDADMGNEVEARLTRRFQNSKYKEEARLALRSAVNPFVDQAAVAQHKESLRFEGEVMGETVKSATTAILQDGGNYDGQVKALDTFLASLPMAENRKADYRRNAIRAYQEAGLRNWIANHPEEATLTLGQTLKDLPTASSNPVVNASVKASKSTGLDDLIPNGTMVFLGSQFIESRFKNDTVPIVDKKTGRPMSSARGGWQVIDEAQRMLGIKDKYDMEEVSPKVAAHFAHNIKRMQSIGITPTPGKVYMYWNLGQGMAEAVLRAAPETSMRELAVRVWGNKGADYIRKVFEGNPSLYKPGMTAAQTIQNIEGKMGWAMRNVQSMSGGTGALAADESVQNALSVAMGGAPTDAIKPDRAFAIYQESLKELRKAKEKNAALDLGTSIVAGDVPVDPYETKHQNALDEHSRNAFPNARQELLGGTQERWNSGYDYAKKYKYLPEPWVNATRELIHDSGSAKSQAKVQAYTLAAQLHMENPTSFDAAKFPPNIAKRVEKYRTYTEGMQLNPTEAITLLQFQDTPEGKRAIEAIEKNPDLKKKFVAKRTYSELAKGVELDQAWFSDPKVTPAQKSAIESKYKELATDFYALSGDENASIKYAQMNLKKYFGVSELWGGQKVMAYPPDKYYDAVNGSHSYMKWQATNLIEAETGKKVSFSDVILYGDQTTAAEINAGQKPTYQVRWRGSDGLLRETDNRFQPDPQLAELYRLIGGKTETTKSSFMKKDQDLTRPIRPFREGSVLDKVFNGGRPTATDQGSGDISSRVNFGGPAGGGE